MSNNVQVVEFGEAIRPHLSARFIVGKPSIRDVAAVSLMVSTEVVTAAATADDLKSMAAALLEIAELIEGDDE